ncbi:MAG: glycine oxidase ThiO [Gemmatimonadales bacterium]|nr:glycine oxidase ThiO [Gemmatimonadales bacterium]
MLATHDVVVIGGGAVGAACARELALGGRRPLVLEPAAGGAAWQAAAGMLAPQIEADGRDPLFELGLAAREVYPQLAGALRESTGIDIGLWQEGIARIASDEAQVADLKSTVAWQRQQGYLCDWLDADETRAHWPWIGTAFGALWARREGALEPARLVQALLADTIRLGGTVVRDAAARIEHVDGRVTAVVGSERYATEAVVVAAGSWSGRIAGLPRPVSVEPVRGQMLALPWPGGVPRSILYNQDCYVVARGNEAVAGSTMEFAGYDASVTEAGVARILRHVAALYPALAGAQPIRTWAGLRPVTPDGLPIVGPAPDVTGLWYATGHGRNGILLAAITGQIVRQLVAGEPTHEAVALLAPERFWRW